VRTAPGPTREREVGVGVSRPGRRHLAPTFVIGARLILDGHHRHVGTVGQPQHQRGNYELDQPKRYEHDPQRHPFRCYYRSAGVQARSSPPADGTCSARGRAVGRGGHATARPGGHSCGAKALISLAPQTA
jgi:hypothetical protein